MAEQGHVSNMSVGHAAIQNSDGQEPRNAAENEENGRFRWTKRKAVIAATIGFVGLVQGSCYALLAPFFPLEAQQKGNSTWQFGLILGVYQLVVFLVAPIQGKLLSSQIPAKVMFCTGIFVDGVCCCLMGTLVLSPPGATFFGLAMAIRIVESIGLTASFTCMNAVVCTEYSRHIELAVPLLELSFGLGLTAGPSVGGVLYQLGGFVLPFVVIGSVLVASSLVAIIIFPNIETPPEESTVSMKDVFDWRILINLLVIGACFLTFGFNDATLAIHLKQFSLKPSISGLIFMVGGSSYALFTFGFGQASKQVADPRYICLFGGIAMITCLALIGPLPFFHFPPSVIFISVSQFLLGIAVAAYYIGSVMHSVKHSVNRKGLPDNISTFGLLSGLASSAFSLGCFLGPIIGGALLDHFGYRWASTFVFGLQVLVMIILVTTVIWDKANQQRGDMKRPLLDGEANCHM